MSDGFDAIHETDDTGGVDESAPEGDPGRRKRHDTRRAIAGGIAGVVMLAGPIVLANTIVGHDDGGSSSSGDDDVATKDGPSPSLIAHRAAQGAQQADTVQLRGLLTRGTSTTIPPTTTTTAPPTTTTTAPPPPPTTDPPTTDPPTTAPPMTAPPSPPSPGSGQLGDPNYDGSWDKLAGCESGGNWHINTGNGYYGGLQFSLGTWQGLGGSGLPSDASREVQIAMGKKLWQTSGWGAWPACTAKFGWR
jgi:hypothetical protein